MCDAHGTSPTNCTLIHPGAASPPQPPAARSVRVMQEEAPASAALSFTNAALAEPKLEPTTAGGEEEEEEEEEAQEPASPAPVPPPTTSRPKKLTTARRLEKILRRARETAAAERAADQAAMTQVAPGVMGRMEEGGRCTLQGAALRNVSALLRRIFRFEQRGSDAWGRATTWCSGRALSAEEWGYVQRTLAGDAIQPMLQRGQRVRPWLGGGVGGWWGGGFSATGWVGWCRSRIHRSIQSSNALDAPAPQKSPGGYPSSMLPKSASGTTIKGPYITGTSSSRPYNHGRQYFSNFCGREEFIWADGVLPGEPASLQSF